MAKSEKLQSSKPQDLVIMMPKILKRMKVPHYLDILKLKKDLKWNQMNSSQDLANTDTTSLNQSQKDSPLEKDSKKQRKITSLDQANTEVLMNGHKDMAIQ